MTRPEDVYDYERNARAVILRVGTVAAVGTNTVDVTMPGGTTLPGVPCTFTPKVGAKVSLLLDRDNALVIGPVASGAPVWTPTVGMKVFQATQTVAQPLPNGTHTPITWGTVDDPYGSWASGAPTRFKPTFAGSFLLTGAIGFASAAPATYAQSVAINYQVEWFRTGALVVLANMNNVTMTNAAVVARPYLVTLNGTTDYVELAAWHNAGAALSTIVSVPSFSSTITVTYAGP